VEGERVLLVVLVECGGERSRWVVVVLRWEEWGEEEGESESYEFDGGDGVMCFCGGR